MQENLIGGLRYLKGQVGVAVDQTMKTLDCTLARVVAPSGGQEALVAALLVGCDVGL
jgi:hypothetical protein